MLIDKKDFIIIDISQKDIVLIKEYINGMTKQERINFFVFAGIIDENMNLTKKYKWQDI